MNDIKHTEKEMKDLMTKIDHLICCIDADIREIQYHQNKISKYLNDLFILMIALSTTIVLAILYTGN